MSHLSLLLPFFIFFVSFDLLFVSSTSPATFDIAGRRVFDSYKVLRIIPETAASLDFLYVLYIGNSTLDFWKEPSSLHSYVDMMVDPAQLEWLTEELEKRNILFSVMMEDVQEEVEREREEYYNAKKSTHQVGDDFYESYHTYDEVITWLKGLTTTYPNLITLQTIGKTYQGRDLVVAKVTSKSGPANKPAVWFDGGIHAREWISVATNVYLLGNLLSDYGTDSGVTSLVDGLEIWVLPVFNADGYVYTWTTDRMWRKTRSPNTGSICVGTDPNRNWDFQWGGAGVSPDPCNDAYLGPSAFSEIEVATVGKFILNAKKFQGYINFHSYSQLWMSPWGYTSSFPADYNIQNSLSSKCVTALQNIHGTSYGYGPISTTIYPASGSSADYTYGAAKVLYSYGVELRDTGRYGFLLPANQIVPSGEETYAAVKIWAFQVLISSMEKM